MTEPETPKRVGRPRSAEKLRMVTFKVKPMEWAIIEAKAKEHCGGKISSYLRLAALTYNRETVSPIKGIENGKSES